MSDDKVYGIDLGTTYSAVALINEFGMPEVIKNFEGDDTTPSVVYFNDDGSVDVGAQAKRTQIEDPENAVSLIKRHMGEEFPLEFRDQEYSPESISALILKELVNNANEQNGYDIHKVVVTVPAYFGIQERQATKQAGEIAGLEVVGIIPEPVAAAISLVAKNAEEETLLVFDLGGGTFDTTVLRAKAGSVNVIAIDGNRLLGGADWDNRLEDLFLKKFIAQAGLDDDDDPSLDEEFMIALRMDVEHAKKLLTKRPTTSVMLQYGGKKAKIEVTREEFEAATADLVAETVAIAERVVKTAQEKEPGLAVDKLLLVGGSSRMPMVENALANSASAFNLERTNYDVDVAKGAAIFGQGELPEFEFSDNSSERSADSSSAPRRKRPGIGPARTVVSNRLAKGLGVEVVRELPTGDWEPYISFLAHRNDELPLSTSMEGGIVQDGQDTLHVALYEQGGEIESEDPSDNKVMASGPTTTMHFPPLRKDDPIDVTLDVSEDGTAILGVTEPQSGRSFKAEAAVSVLSPEEVAAAKAQIARIKTRS